MLFGGKETMLSGPPSLINVHHWRAAALLHTWRGDGLRVMSWSTSGRAAEGRSCDITTGRCLI